jgi:hypothetical protein
VSNLREQWDSYGARPPVARWTARVSMVVGVAIGIAIVATLAAGLVWALVKVWRWIIIG